MKINTLSESSPPLHSPPLPSSREKEMQVQINNLSEKIEKIGKYVIKSIQELKDSLNKVEAVLKLEGIKAGLATATPQDQKELLGERLFPEIQKMNSPLAGKLTGMMLEKSNEEILQKTRIISLKRSKLHWISSWLKTRIFSLKRSRLHWITSNLTEESLW